MLRMTERFPQNTNERLSATVDDGRYAGKSRRGRHFGRTAPMAVRLATLLRGRSRLILRATTATAATATAAAVVYASSSPAESSGSKPLVIKSKDDGALKPGLELLVHNISHADMVVRLQETPLDETSSSTGVGFGFRNFLARPQFNAFMPISVEIFNAIAEEEARGQTPGVIACTSKYKVQYPTGIDLQSAGSGGVEILPKASDVAAGRFSTAWSLFHLKKPADEKGTKLVMGRDLAAENMTYPRVIAVYLPIIAVVIPEWIRAIKRRALQATEDRPPPRKVLVLVSGAGQPRDEKANPADNSTEGTGRIIQRFLKIVHPDIEVVHITSAYGIYRYARARVHSTAAQQARHTRSHHLTPNRHTFLYTQIR